MSKIRRMSGHPFQHDGRDYLIGVLATADGVALIVNRREPSGAFEETGHRAYLPASSASEDVQAAAIRLQQRVEAGDTPDEESGRGH